MSLAGILLPLVIYPVAIILISRFYKPVCSPALVEHFPVVSVVSVFHNSQHILSKKIENLLELSYPTSQLEIVMISDGSKDGGERIVQKYKDQGIDCIVFTEHLGKAEPLNRVIPQLRGEIIIYSDVASLLAPDAIYKLVRHYSQNPMLGGVGGNIIILKDQIQLQSAQANYFQFDKAIKISETRCGCSITSNYGTLYSFRRILFTPYPAAVTDDLFACMSTVAQGYRFIFDPEAVSYIPARSRGGGHEIRRRRRIVCRSLTGIWHMKKLFNPFYHFWYGLRLGINKVLRRLLPLQLILFFVSNLMLATEHVIMMVFAVGQGIFFSLALCYPFLNKMDFLPKKAIKTVSLIFYFTIGNFGTLLGLFDFLCGKKVVKWNPVLDRQTILPKS